LLEGRARSIGRAFYCPPPFFRPGQSRPESLLNHFWGQAEVFHRRTPWIADETLPSGSGFVLEVPKYSLHDASANPRVAGLRRPNSALVTLQNRRSPDSHLLPRTSQAPDPENRRGGAARRASDLDALVRDPWWPRCLLNGQLRHRRAPFSMCFALLWMHSGVEMDYLSAVSLHPRSQVINNRYV